MLRDYPMNETWAKHRERFFSPPIPQVHISTPPQIGFLCTVLAAMELTLYTRLASNTERSPMSASQC